jgi:hypothetical protein
VNVRMWECECKMEENASKLSLYTRRMKMQAREIVKVHTKMYHLKSLIVPNSLCVF